MKRLTAILTSSNFWLALLFFVSGMLMFTCASHGQTWYAPHLFPQHPWSTPRVTLPQTVVLLDAGTPVQMPTPRTDLYSQLCMPPTFDRRATGLERSQEAQNPFLAPLRDQSWRDSRTEREQRYCSACPRDCTGEPPRIRRELQR